MKQPDLRPGQQAHRAVEGQSAEASLAAERALLDRLASIAPIFTSELDADRLMRRLTDEATSIVGAQFGAFFYNVTRSNGDAYVLYTLSGAPREAFERFGMPRATAVFGPTFAGEGVVRLDDVTKDPRYGKNTPHQGMPKGHLPVVSYLAVPVRSMNGTVLGGLFFGHPEAGVFTEREERAVVALAAMAAAALDNARMVRSLEAANARLRLVNEATREGIWYWDVATDSVEWNGALLATMGIEAGAWGGGFADWMERIHPDDQPRLAAALDAHLARREPYHIELFRLRHTSGEYRWLTTVGQAEWDEEGRPTRMAGSVRDVTDRKMAEDAQRAREHRQNQILDSIRDMVFCKDAALRIAYANAATCKFYETTAEALRGLTDVPYNAIDFTKQYNADDREVFETGRVVERHEEPNTSPAGQVRFFHTVKSPIFDEAGRVVELVGVSRDVTERKRAVERERKLSEASAILSESIDYESTLSNVARAMVPLLADWCAVDVLEGGKLRRLAVAHTDPAKVALAYELDERYPQSLDAPAGVPNVLRTGSNEHVPDLPDEVLATFAQDEEHLAILRALGLSSYVIVPLKAHQRVIGAITLVTDGARHLGAQDIGTAEELARRVSSAVENALLYREVRALNAGLEERVVQRTSALLEANAELEAFSYTVSHDLRAPIRHIGGFLDLLRAHAGSVLDAKAIHYVDTIKSASRQMAALIDGLLSFSRLGRAEIAKQRIDLGALTSDVLRDLESETGGRDITWVVGPLPTVEADPTMLRLVLTNLLSNAVKYTRRRAAARIEVGSHREAAEVVIFVKDNGAGFDMTYLNKLFGVFQRLHADSEFEGTGIGLATTRRIVQRHGGRVWASGTVGEGAAFYFALPALPALGAEPA